MKIVDQAANAVSFVEDKVHESHFDRIIWMLRTRRDEAAREVPEWEQLRELASQIKERTLSRLGGYLEEFEASAIMRGVHVHWARDAHEHNEVLYSVLAVHGKLAVFLFQENERRGDCFEPILNFTSGESGIFHSMTAFA